MMRRNLFYLPILGVLLCTSCLKSSFAMESIDNHQEKEIRLGQIKLPQKLSPIMDQYPTKASTTIAWVTSEYFQLLTPYLSNKQKVFVERYSANKTGKNPGLLLEAITQLEEIISKNPQFQENLKKTNHGTITDILGDLSLFKQTLTKKFTSIIEDAQEHPVNVLPRRLLEHVVYAQDKVNFIESIPSPTQRKLYFESFFQDLAVALNTSSKNKQPSRFIIKDVEDLEIESLKKTISKTEQKYPGKSIILDTEVSDDSSLSNLVEYLKQASPSTFGVRFEQLDPNVDLKILENFVQHYNNVQFLDLEFDTYSISLDNQDSFIYYYANVNKINSLLNVFKGLIILDLGCINEEESKLLPELLTTHHNFLGISFSNDSQEKVSEQFLAQILASLKNQRFLRTIQLYDFEITDEHANILSKLIEESLFLCELELSKCVLTEEGKRVLTKALEKNSERIITLKISEEDPGLDDTSSSSDESDSSSEE